MSLLSPTTKELADSAIKKLASGQSTFIADAIRKSVLGCGITNQADVKRRTREVAKELQRRSVNAKVAKKNLMQANLKMASRYND